jgi:hypothetical protein
VAHSAPLPVAPAELAPLEPDETRRLLDSLPEAVIVRHSDGTLGVYAPDEWPSDGDGEIVARKLPDGEVGWYAGSDAGPRTDPRAFWPADPERPLHVPRVRRESDGTVTIDGVPADDCMFGGKCARSAGSDG